jgi:hypothetical protein
MDLDLEDINKIAVSIYMLPSDSLLKCVKTEHQFNYGNELRKENYLLAVFWAEEAYRNRLKNIQDKPEIQEELRRILKTLKREIEEIDAHELTKEIIRQKSEYFNELWLLVDLLHKPFRAEITPNRYDDFPVSSLDLFLEIIAVELNNKFRFSLKDKFEHSLEKNKDMLKLCINYLDGKIERINDVSFDLELKSGMRKKF